MLKINLLYFISLTKHYSVQVLETYTSTLVPRTPSALIVNEMFAGDVNERKTTRL